MKKFLRLFLVCSSVFSLSACSTEEQAINVEPELSQMQSICELAVMDCYYHNVAKFKEEDAEGVLFWKKDKHFWIEYSGVVSLGIDASLLSIDVNEEDIITISIPNAKVLGCRVDSSSLKKEAYIIAKDSAPVSAEDEIEAFGEAQTRLEEKASSDKTLLNSAQQRVQSLLEDYVTNIGNAIGKTYTVKWNYIEENIGNVSTISDNPIVKVNQSSPEDTGISALSE